METKKPNWHGDPSWLRWSRRRGGLIDLKNLIGRYIFERLPDPAGPANLDSLRDAFLPHPEVYALVAGGEIAPGRRNRCVLLSGARHQCDLRANGVAVALVPNQFQQNPMVPFYRFVVENVNRAVIGGHDRVEPAVVIEVANCQSTRNPGLAEEVARLLGNIHKPVPRIAG